MAKIQINRFTAYELTEEEELRGSILDESQKQVLQNLLSKAAMDKQNLKPDPSDIKPFIQEDAFLAGQIQLLEYILEQSTYAEQAILEISSDASSDKNEANQPAQIMSVFSQQ